MFGKKESIFDQGQNKQLQALAKSHANIWTWLKTFEKWFQGIHPRLTNIEKANQRQDQYDKSVHTTLEGLKLHSHPALAKQIQELAARVQKLETEATVDKALDDVVQQGEP